MGEEGREGGGATGAGVQQGEGGLRREGKQDEAAVRGGTGGGGVCKETGVRCCVLESEGGTAGEVARPTFFFLERAQPTPTNSARPPQFV